jgi:hypothetical protein
MTAVDSPASHDPLGGLERRADGTFDVVGRSIGIPVEVRSAQMASATFLVDADAAQAVIEGTGLRVARKALGKAVVSLALVRYLDGDLDTYDEIGLAFVVEEPAGQPTLPRGGVATYIHKLPVSEEFTCHAGRGIWGFPKWVAPMSVRFGEGGVTAELDGEVRIHLGRGLLPVPSRPLTMACYSNDHTGAILRTEWVTETSSTRLRVGPGTARVELLGSGPVADDLRALGFPRRPLLSMSAARMHATFGAPARV